MNENFTPFNGGSRTIQLRLASQEKILMSALMSFIIGITLVSYLVVILESNELFILLCFGIFLAFFYTAKPLKLSHHGLGEVSNFLGYGPVLTLSAYLIQTKGIYEIDKIIFVFYWSVVPGLLLALILLINEFQDYDSDKSAGKKTLIVRIGKNKGKTIYNLVSILTFVVIIVGIAVFSKYSLLGIISLIGIVLFYKASRLINENTDKIAELLPANALTVQNHLITNLLLMVGFVLTKVILG